MADANTPLGGQSFSMSDFAMEELPLCAKITVRGESEKITAAIEGATALSPVMDANTFRASAENTLFWMGPDERMLYGKQNDATELLEAITGNLPVGQSAAVDVSDYYTVISVSGHKARAVLASGTPFNVHTDVFGEGQCAQTRFGNASVLISRVEESTYHVQVRWSFAQYLWQYLSRVARYV